jgi:hypothetical protein
VTGTLQVAPDGTLDLLPDGGGEPLPLDPADEVVIVAGPALAAAVPVPALFTDLMVFAGTPEGALTRFTVTLSDGRAMEIRELT